MFAPEAQRLFPWAPVSCIVSTPLTTLLLRNMQIKGLKCFTFEEKPNHLVTASIWQWKTHRTLAVWFNKHKRPYLHSLEQKKPPPCCLLDSQRMRHFLGHCFLPSPLRDLDYPQYTCIQYMYTHTASEMVRWAGRPGGGTDVQAHWMIVGGGGGLTGRKWHEEGARSS